MGSNEVGSHTVSTLRQLKIGTQDAHKPLHLEKAMFSSAAFSQAVSARFPFPPSGFPGTR